MSPSRQQLASGVPPLRRSSRLAKRKRSPSPEPPSKKRHTGGKERDPKDDPVVDATTEKIALPPTAVGHRVETRSMGAKRRQQKRISKAHQYFRLYEVQTLDEFKSVFIDIIKAHHSLYNLKEDKSPCGHLGESNLMFHRCEEGRVYGVIHDCDPAMKTVLRVDSADAASDASGPPPAGKHKEAFPTQNPLTPNTNISSTTSPFTSIDISSSTSASTSTSTSTSHHHLYRHDLESFFWILLWCSCLYNLNGSKRNTPYALYEWTPSSYSSSSSASLSKRHLLLQEKEGQMRWLGENLTEEFKPLGKEWIGPLWDLVKEGYEEMKRRATSMKQPGDYDDETLGGNLTFEGFMDIMGGDSRDGDLVG